MTQQDRVHSLFGLDGRVAIVTGGAQGLGKTIAQLFADAGATVVVADVDLDKANAFAAAASAAGSAIEAVEADVSDERSVQQMTETVAGRHGRIDVLVNNAGIFPKAPILEYTMADFDRVQAVNLRGAFLCTREVARVMVANGTGGRIVNIASLASIHPGVFGNTAYSASKGGLVSMTRSAALELGADHINVNALLPAGFDVEDKPVEPGTVSGPSRTPGRVLLGRTGTEPIAACTLFLASDAARHVTGQTLVADGGFLVT
jgi:NAD(P)-dependent dehydrogenase (short-subunit alcohol dehydrogenase family)